MTTASAPTAAPEIRVLWASFAMTLLYSAVWPLLSTGASDIPRTLLYALLLISVILAWLFTRRVTSWMVKVIHGTSGPADLRGMLRWRTTFLAVSVVLLLGSVSELSSLPARGVGSILVGLTMVAFTWLAGPVIRAVQGTGTRMPGAADTLRALLPRWTWAGRLLQVMLIAYVFVVEES